MEPRTAELKVMTFNILDYSNNANGWVSESGVGRRERVIETIEALQPDIFGLQEDRQNQVGDLRDALGDVYDSYGVGGDDGDTEGRYCSIFYRRERFTRAAQGTFWLSDEPDAVGSHFPGNPTVRIASWVKLRDKATHRTCFVLNTHWDNGQQSARAKSAAIFRERIPTLSGGLPVIVTGDLNAEEDNTAFLELLGRNDPEGLQLLDSHRDVSPEKTEEEGTAHMFGGSAKCPRIDYVLHSGFFRTTAVVVDRSQRAGGWASDHFAVMATFEAPVAAGE